MDDFIRNFLGQITRIGDYPVQVKYLGTLALVAAYFYHRLFVRKMLHGWWRGDLMSNHHPNLRYECELYLLDSKGKEIQGKLLYKCMAISREASIRHRGFDYISSASIDFLHFLNTKDGGIRLQMNREFTDQHVSEDAAKSPAYAWSCKVDGFWTFRPQLKVVVRREDVNPPQIWTGILRKES